MESSRGTTSLEPGIVRRNSGVDSPRRTRPGTISQGSSSGSSAIINGDMAINSTNSPNIMDAGKLLEALEASQAKIKELQLEIANNENKLQLYQNVSQKCSDAYEELKLKYEAESDASNTVMVKASQWYKENKKLKRKSTFLLNKLQTCNLADEIKDDETEDGSEEVQGAEENVAGFMADMKSRLGDVTIEKDQALKQVKVLQQRVKAEHKRYKEEAFAHKQTQDELECQKAMLNRLTKVSIMAVGEFDAIRGRLAEKEAIAQKAVNEIQEVDRERKALKRTSALLMTKIAPDQQLVQALMQVEQMTVALEAANSELEDRKNKEEELNNNLESLRDKLKWSTDECMEAENKEKKNAEKIQSLEKTVRDLTEKLEMKSANKAPPAPPPPPPPMPAQQWSWNPLGMLMNAIGLSRTETSKKNLNLAAPKDDMQKKAMDDMMQKIERGEFRLRPIGINPIDEDNHAEESANPAIDEFRNVFGTLKKGGSLRQVKQSKPVTRQNFTYSLRSKERGQIPTFPAPDEKPLPASELQSKLVKRRQAISVVLEEP